MMLGDLKQGSGFWYVGTPYSQFHLGIVAAYRAAAVLSGRLIGEGVKVFSPICHSHPINEICGGDPLDYSVWLPVDQVIAYGSRGLLIGTMEGWDKSYGVGVETEWFRHWGKPIFLVDPAQLVASSHGFPLSHVLLEQQVQRQRLAEMVGRFARASDADMTDKEFFDAIAGRVGKHFKEIPLDPSE